MPVELIPLPAFGGEVSPAQLRRIRVELKALGLEWRDVMGIWPEIRGSASSPPDRLELADLRDVRGLFVWFTRERKRRGLPRASPVAKNKAQLVEQAEDLRNELGRERWRSLGLPDIESSTVKVLRKAIASAIEEKRRIGLTGNRGSSASRGRWEGGEPDKGGPVPRGRR